jgi:hypothetical protein
VGKRSFDTEAIGRGAVGRVVIIGDSHVHAIKDALEARGPSHAKGKIVAQRLLKSKPLPAIDGAPPQGRLRRLVGSARKIATGKRPGAMTAVFGDVSLDDALKLARRLRPEDVLVSVIGGNQHAVFSTIQHPQPFDFELPDGAGRLAAGGAELIPFRTLYPYFRAALRDGDGKTIATFRKSTSARMIQLLAPPPKRMNDWIEQHHDTLFVAEGLARQGVSKPELRLKFWQLQNRAIEEICIELGVEVLRPPESSLDPDGFLARPFFAGDATHANRRYGELVLEQLEAMLLQASANAVKAA